MTVDRRSMIAGLSVGPRSVGPAPRRLHRYPPPRIAPAPLLLTVLILAGSVPVEAASAQRERADRAVPEGYALVVGISRYPNLEPEAQLRYAERDAESIYTTLISPQGGNFKAENVRKLIGPEATRLAITEELEGWLPSTAGPEDRVVVYFAGHGFAISGRTFLAPYDFDPDVPDATGYPMSDVGEVFGSQIQATWKVLLTDACHSGAIAPAADRETINRSLQDLDASVFSLTASREGESSLEHQRWGGGHGVFTYYVVKAMDGEADGNRDGRVTADELAEYVRANVRHDTGGGQNPTSDRASYDPEMLLAYFPSVTTGSAAEMGVLVVESSMDRVEVFLDGTSVGVYRLDAEALRLEAEPGLHRIRGVKAGYEPVEFEEIVFPGRESAIRIGPWIASRPR